MDTNIHGKWFHLKDFLAISVFPLDLEILGSMGEGVKYNILFEFFQTFTEFFSYQ